MSDGNWQVQSDLVPGSSSHEGERPLSERRAGWRFKASHLRGSGDG